MICKSFRDSAARLRMEKSRQETTLRHRKHLCIFHHQCFLVPFNLYNDDRAGNTDTDMSEQERIVAKDLERGYAMVLPVILGYLQPQPQQCGGDEEQARLYPQAAYLCFTVALVALTASGPLPSASKTLQFSLFLLILGYSLLLSLAAPGMLGWAPYFSCIRPLFHLLPAEFQLRILHFSQPAWDNTKQLLILLSNVPSRFWILQSSKSKWNALAGLVAAGAIPNAQHSSPAQANLNSLQAVKLCEQQVCSREASTASLASSSSDYQSNLEWVLKHLAQLNLEQVHTHLEEEVKPLEYQETVFDFRFAMRTASP